MAACCTWTQLSRARRLRRLDAALGLRTTTQRTRAGPEVSTATTSRTRDPVRCMLRLLQRLEGTGSTVRASILFILLLLCGSGTIGQVASASGQRAGMSASGDSMLDSSNGLWNGEIVPRELARSVLGWNPYMDVVGAGVYGGIVKRDPATGAVLLGHEWPENNADWSYGPHNNVAPHKGLKSPFLDMAQYTQTNRGYAHISNLVTSGDARALQQLFEQLGDDKPKRKSLANLVMAGGARPLHMAGMTRGGNPKEVVRILIGEGAEPNAMDAYAMTPLDRMLSNRVAAAELQELGGTERGPVRSDAVPAWDDPEYAYTGGVGESEP